MDIEVIGVLGMLMPNLLVSISFFSGKSSRTCWPALLCNTFPKLHQFDIIETKEEIKIESETKRCFFQLASNVVNNFFHFKDREWIMVIFAKLTRKYIHSSFSYLFFRKWNKKSAKIHNYRNDEMGHFITLFEYFIFQIWLDVRCSLTLIFFRWLLTDTDELKKTKRTSLETWKNQQIFD